ncbi:MAG: chemotaxis protein CheX [Magnetococcus sp. WYHC-3]
MSASRNNAEENRRRLLDGLQKTVYDVMSTMAWSEVSFVGMEEVSGFTLKGGVAGMIRMMGEHQGIIGFTTRQHVAGELVSRITGLAASDLENEDLLDGVAELANMIGGGMKSKADIGGVDLTPPLALVGQEFTAVWKTHLPTFVLTFMLEEDVFRVYASV